MPLDGDILYGEALLSMQHITGENLPLRRGPGAQVPAGSQSHDGVLVLRVTQRAEDSTPARISRLARDAQVRCNLVCGVSQSLSVECSCSQSKRPTVAKCVGG